MSSFGAALEQFEGIVGAEHLVTATGGVADLRGVSDYAVDGQMPLAVAHPGTPEEVAALLHAAREQGLSVLPRGAGRHLHLGRVPGPIGLVISLARLDQVVAYDANDLTITVQAGMTLGALQHLAAAHGQMLPLDPPGAAQATLGGIAAANAAGPLRVRYGAPRDLALGLRVALSSGEIIRTGARTVKNVAGYDLSKLFVGSFGSLGTILEVTLRLLPVPETRAFFAASLSTPRAREVAAALLGGHLDIATCDMLNDAAERHLKLYLPLARRPEHVMLFVGAMGAPEAVARQERELKALLPEGVIRLEPEALWERVRDLPAAAAAGECVLRLSVPLPAVVELVEVISSRPGWCAVSRVGDGTVYALGPEIADVLFLLRRAAEAHGGHAVLERGTPELKRAFPVWGEPVANVDLMQALKRGLDPSDTLGCGRFVV